MTLESVTLEDALRLLSLPRVVCEIDGEQVLAQNGRYGPFVKKGTETRSLESEDQLFTLTEAEAIALFAQPKARRRGGAKPPLKDFGEVAEADGRRLVVKDGRFGPYVTDGETNASLRRGDDVESLTVERALELLADKRAAGPAASRSRGTRRR
jgi:DNA topoisomerase-1